MSTPKFGNDPRGTSEEKVMMGASPHILVVDDTLLDRLIVSRLLKHSNIRVTAVEGVQEALKFLDTEHDVDMIVSDYSMPEMTGYDLLMEVKKSPQLEHLPVVIASSDNIPERIKKCLDGGAKDYILKPIKVADVPRILRHM